MYSNYMHAKLHRNSMEALSSTSSLPINVIHNRKIEIDTSQAISITNKPQLTSRDEVPLLSPFLLLPSSFSFSSILFSLLPPNKTSRDTFMYPFSHYNARISPSSPLISLLTSNTSQFSHITPIHAYNEIDMIYA